MVFMENVKYLNLVSYFLSNILVQKQIILIIYVSIILVMLKFFFGALNQQPI